MPWRDSSRALPLCVDPTVLADVLPSRGRSSLSFATWAATTPIVTPWNFPAAMITSEGTFARTTVVAGLETASQPAPPHSPSIRQDGRSKEGSFRLSANRRGDGGH